jgi:hypothetical protein
MTWARFKEKSNRIPDNGKQELYKQIIEEAKDATENHNIDKLKKLSEIAVAVEEVSERELLKSFDDENPLREANIVVESDGLTNYLFSLGCSSKLYDLRENTGEALYEAIKSDDVELVKHVLTILLPEAISKMDLNYLNEELSKAYEEPNLSKDMKNYLEKKIRLYGFLCGCKNNMGAIELFANRPEADYEIDRLLLFLIVEKVEEEELLCKINGVIELLTKYERFEELEYKVRRLKSELESGKSKYPIEIVQESIEKREKEMREIEEKYIRPTDLVGERERLVKRLLRTVTQ